MYLLICFIFTLYPLKVVGEEIRIINQSLMRGGQQFIVFYTYNPPNSIRNWV
ncbi:MAG: phage terminase large subunit, partial [Petroclostridium sp.]|nr:phage terminase large subunit [Petroclostridium sp.]